MATSYRLNRILLKDNFGKLYRIFSYAFAVDSHGEKYLKIVFPDLSKKPVGSVHLANSQEPQGRKVTQKEADGIAEFSMHYEGGVSHYKDDKNTRVWQRRDIPKTQDANLMHVLRLTIYRLSAFKEYQKPLVPSDYVIPIKFGDKGRIFNLYIVDAAFNVDVKPADLKTNLLAAHAFSPVVDPKVRLIAVDSEFIELPNTTESFALFTYDDLTAPSRPPATAV